ncbi:hypothetical protein V6N13_133131 [Hibiscus sabdariffa]|uniref:Uncharacterized protein n=1 Tax=Hibiscus sabdariffa TaxID=183260 RepID=A0ABR2AMY8_9ROSI
MWTDVICDDREKHVFCQSYNCSTSSHQGILEELGNYCHVSSSTIFRSSERHVRCRLFTKSDSHPKVCSVDGLPMLLEEFEELDRESKTVGKSQKVKVKKQNAT